MKPPNGGGLVRERGPRLFQGNPGRGEILKFGLMSPNHQFSGDTLVSKKAYFLFFFWGSAASETGILNPRNNSGLGIIGNLPNS